MRRIANASFEECPVSLLIEFQLQLRQAAESTFVILCPSADLRAHCIYCHHMPDLGNLIHIARDDEGEIHVYEDTRFRYLTFGNHVEQSCLDLKDPVCLHHVYTQAMMLAVPLHPTARSALLLGVGGGSLARALRAAERHMHITGVEYRAAVLDTARGWFQLPVDRRFDAVCDDADAFLQQSEQSFDLIFADLYLADGMYPRQTAGDFLQRCREHLTDDGILVLNQWAGEYATNHTALANLGAAFDGRVLNVYPQGGSIVSFAFRSGVPGLNPRAWFAAAQALGARLSIPLQQHARRLWQQNAAVLRSGRLRR